MILNSPRITKQVLQAHEDTGRGTTYLLEYVGWLSPRRNNHDTTDKD